MEDFYLTRTDSLGSVKCPNCNAEFDIEWNTEYGDFLYGVHETECSGCETTFVFSGGVTYSSWAIAK